VREVPGCENRALIALIPAPVTTTQPLPGTLWSFCASSCGVTNGPPEVVCLEHASSWRADCDNPFDRLHCRSCTSLRYAGAQRAGL